jgi:serine/threonine protein kinase
MDLIKLRGTQLEQQFIDSKTHSFHDSYVLGEKLGEGQHASVYKCFKRVKPRSANECTPLLAKQLNNDDYVTDEPYAVKIVRDDDIEKIIAHEREFEILLPLNHINIVRAKEIFRNEFKNEVFQVMEYIEGQEILDEIAQSGAYTKSEAQRLYK